MDRLRNPYAPGAGSEPPELAGRGEIIDALLLNIRRVRQGRHDRSVVLLGLRGVGKTVLLQHILREAEREENFAISIEAPENRSLPAMIAPPLRQILLRLSRVDAAKASAARAFKALAGFARGLKLSYGDIAVNFDYEPEPGLADNGDLELDLAALLGEVGSAASAAKTAVVLFIDELQYVKEPELAALVSALHQCSQHRLPVIVAGAGLPQIRGKLGKAKSYAERLFEFREIGALSAPDAQDALVKPANGEGVEIEDAAAELIIAETGGYPYFLQEWGKHAWNLALGSTIRRDDVVQASAETIAALDDGFFRVRFDRLTPVEKRYLRAMAELGAGPHRSGDIADVLERSVSSFGPIRASLISKGMIWSPTHGDTAFTVPLFDQFMKRIMRGDDWKTPGR